MSFSRLAACHILAPPNAACQFQWTSNFTLHYFHYYRPWKNKNSTTCRYFPSVSNWKNWRPLGGSGIQWKAILDPFLSQHLQPIFSLAAIRAFLQDPLLYSFTVVFLNLFVWTLKPLLKQAKTHFSVSKYTVFGTVVLSSVFVNGHLISLFCPAWSKKSAVAE